MARSLISLEDVAVLQLLDNLQNRHTSPCIKLGLRSSMIFGTYSGLKSPAAPSDQQITYMQSLRFSGVLSDRSIRHMQEILQQWAQVLLRYNSSILPSSSFKPRKLVFATFTLPSAQNCDDRIFKRAVFIPFISYLVRYGHTTYYFWRAEAQKNGNIHFHCIFDKFIDMKFLQDLWLKFLDNLGLYTSYLSLNKNQKPPATHISCISNIDSIVSYVSKYFSKNENNRPILGRLWGCSDALRSMDSFTYEIEDVKSFLFTLKHSPSLFKINYNEYAIFINYKNISDLLAHFNNISCMHNYVLDDLVRKMYMLPSLFPKSLSTNELSDSKITCTGLFDTAQLRFDFSG